VGDKSTGLGDRAVEFEEKRLMVFQVRPKQYHCYQGLGNHIENELSSS